MRQTEVLRQLSTCDTELLRTAKHLEGLPERDGIMECRAKRKELKAKQDQVVELTDDVDAKLAKLSEEETRIIEKLKDLQATLDATSDYRVTSSVTRDMEGLVKRQGTLAQEQDELLERQIKIDNLAAQVSGMLAQVDHREHHLTEDFKAKGGEIRARQEQLNAERVQLTAQLDEAVLARYERLRAEKGGMGVAFLEDGHCSVCRAELQTGQLQKLLAGPELTECPNCHRLFVVERGE